VYICVCMWVLRTVENMVWEYTDDLFGRTTRVIFNLHPVLSSPYVSSVTSNWSECSVSCARHHHQPRDVHKKTQSDVSNYLRGD